MNWIDAGSSSDLMEGEVLRGRVDRMLPSSIMPGPALEVLHRTAEQLNMVNPAESYTYTGAAFPPGGINVGVGTFLSATEAKRAVERWWAYWEKNRS